MSSINSELSERGWRGRASAADVRNAYRLLLGRPVESLESVNVKTAMTVQAMVEQILSSHEFVEFIETPLLDTGTVKPWLYDGFPRPRLLVWAAEMLPVGGVKRRLLKAQTWREALAVIYRSPAFLKYLKSESRLAHLTEMAEKLDPNDPTALAQAMR